MNDTVICVKNLSKQYRIGQKQRYKTFREAIGKVFRFSSEPAELANRTFWALKDINFEITRGEVVGVIGRNGAGKSTLLKVLSRITEPTTGEVRTVGRVGSLLEVGTGFHGELTGRENVYLNGAILGMRRAEITAKFDEIVAFAEIDQFLDTPVKFYSSGMYTRLAFAVAAHLEPEILIVDEVLAVGDVEFQKKCMGKMRDVAHEGRTVLFVSHNLPAVRSLCVSGILLDHGRLAFQGDSSLAIDRYLATSGKADESAEISFTRPSEAAVWVTKIQTVSNGMKTAKIQMGQPLTVVLDFESSAPIKSPQCSLLISNAGGVELIHVSTRFLGQMQSFGTRNSGRIKVDFGVVPLVEDSYEITFWLGLKASNDHYVRNAMQFDVLGTDIWNNGWMPPKVVSPMWWPARFAME